MKMFDDQKYQIDPCCDIMTSFLLNEETRMDWSEDGMPYLWMADCDCFSLNYCPFCGKKIGLKERVI